MEIRSFLIILIFAAPDALCYSRKLLNEDVSYHPFDKDLYKDVLDPELCQQQVQYVRNNNTVLWARFLDAGIRLPRGIFMGNTKDMGNYYECLDINHDMDERNIQGKYCVIEMKLNQGMNYSYSQESAYSDNEALHFIQDNIDNIKQIKINKMESGLKYDPNSNHESKMEPDSGLQGLEFKLAVCIPASCTTREGIDGLLLDVSALGINYEEEFCRLPNDKPWAPVDYVATVMFSIIGILTFLCTIFDLYYVLFLKKDKRNTNSLFFCFSLYTNTKRILTFTSGPDSLECVDGIRALAMVWVILGHSFSALPYYSNPLKVFEFTISPNAIWVTSAHLTVDTFFFLSGMLVVYSIAGKISGEKLLRGLHKFYLNRLLRMFPILAAMTLFETSFYNYVADGPFWEGAALGALRCRQYWWSTLLHIQNFVNPQNLCLGVSWYLSVDVQLHILSPLILFWVLSPRKHAAWAALTVGLLVILTASTLYIFYNNFPSGVFSPNRPNDMGDYYKYYYINVLTRAPPFFVGMIFGYILYMWKGKKLNIAKIISLLFWCGSFVLLGSSIYCTYINIQLDWNNQAADNFINSFTRSLWAAGLGWVIFACVKGYGGPINWLLSLQVWKLPARLSYAMYIIHYSIIIAYYYSTVSLPYFTVSNVMFNFFGFFFLTFALSFVATVFIDSPFSTLIKMFIDKGTSRSVKVEEKRQNTENITPLDINTNLTNLSFVADDKSLPPR